MQNSGFEIVAGLTRPLRNRKEIESLVDDSPRATYNTEANLHGAHQLFLRVHFGSPHFSEVTFSMRISPGSCSENRGNTTNMGNKSKEASILLFYSSLWI